MRRRKFWMVLLGFGAIAGFASGMHSLRHGECGCGPQGWDRHGAFERHVADVCVDAAERAHPHVPAGTPQVVPQ
jgi:hypothetical protein